MLGENIDFCNSMLVLWTSNLHEFRPILHDSCYEIYRNFVNNIWEHALPWNPLQEFFAGSQRATGISFRAIPDRQYIK